MTVRFTLKDYFYAMEIDNVETIQQGLKQLYEEFHGDLSNVSEIYDGNESYVVEDMTEEEIKSIIEAI